MNFFVNLQNGVPSLVAAAALTARVAVLAILIGTCLGVLGGAVLAYAPKLVALPLRLYVDLMRGLPGLVLVFVFYYPLGFALTAVGVRYDAWVAGMLALSAVCVADVAELTRGALQSLPVGQMEAGKALGLRFRQILRRVILPQALLRMLPPWTNTATEMVKGTTLLSLIGVTELLLTAKQLTVNGYALYFFLVIGAVFFAFNTILQLLASVVERRLDYDRSSRKEATWPTATSSTS